MRVGESEAYPALRGVWNGPCGPSPVPPTLPFMKIEYTTVIADTPPWQLFNPPFVITSREWQLMRHELQPVNTCCEQMYVAILSDNIIFQDETSGGVPFGMFLHEQPFARDDFSMLPAALPIKVCPWCATPIKLVEAHRVRRRFEPKPIAELGQHGFVVVDTLEPQ